MRRPARAPSPLDILLIEDDPNHAELIRRNFAEHPIANRIHHLSDGEAALDYLFRRGRYEAAEDSPLPHAILLDLRLPKLDGLEVLKQIRESASLNAIPVIVLTTSRERRDVGRAYKHHANSYLIKPLESERFNDLMQDLGRYWLGWNHRMSQIG